MDTQSPDLDALLSTFVNIAQTKPLNPEALLKFAGTQPKETMISIVKHGLPMPWHNSAESLLEPLSEDEVRAVAAFLAIAFVQGVNYGLSAKITNGKNGV